VSPARSKVSDDGILAAAQRAMRRRGPHELTLADIAGEAGVSPGRLVQRFGSKRALLLVLAERFAGSARATFDALRAAHPRPLAALRAYAACMADLAATPEALSRNLAYLHIDLTDPDFRRHLLTNLRDTRREIESLLRAAVAEGALSRGPGVQRLARAIEAVIGGSLMSWACYREGRVADWVRHDLDTVLQPHLTRRRELNRSAGRSKRPRRGRGRAPRR
jgi:AcrR family transcriptional regulator